MRYLALAALLCLVVMVMARVIQLKKLGIRALHFAEMDKKDFLILPFALGYFYLVLAAVFGWPTLGSELFHFSLLEFLGLLSCSLGVALFVWAMRSFGRSFRVGLDETTPGKLITEDAFAISRNPIYVAFSFVLLGIFLIIPNYLLLILAVLAVLLFYRQIRLEEASLEKIYGEAYRKYCQNVKRFL